MAIRANDIVKVVNRIRVTRVGYPKTVDDYVRELETTATVDSIQKLVESTGVEKPHFFGFGQNNQPAKVVLRNNRWMNMIIRVLATRKAKHDGFGGSERSIYMWPIDPGPAPTSDGNFSLMRPDRWYNPFDWHATPLDRCRVIQTKRAVTGIRHGGYDGGWWEDSEGPSLSEAKHHHLLRIEPMLAGGGYPNESPTERVCFPEQFWVRAEDVVLVERSPRPRKKPDRVR